MCLSSHSLRKINNHCSYKNKRQTNHVWHLFFSMGTKRKIHLALQQVLEGTTIFKNFQSAEYCTHNYYVWDSTQILKYGRVNIN